MDEGIGSTYDDKNISASGERKMKFMKRDTAKIKTNVKYKCVDEASEDETINNKTNLNDVDL